MVEGIGEERGDVEGVCLCFGKEECLGGRLEEVEIVGVWCGGVVWYLEGRGINVEVGKRECSEGGLREKGKG